jgi:hypothetical protein
MHQGGILNDSEPIDPYFCGVFVFDYGQCGGIAGKIYWGMGY